MDNDSLSPLCSSLSMLGLGKVVEQARSSFSGNARDDANLLISRIEEAADTFFNERALRYIRRAKLPCVHSLAELQVLPERKLDIEYIRELDSLGFIDDRRNLIIWGAPGTGKTWIAMMIASSACKAGRRTRWMTFPELYRDLERRRDKKDMAYESRLRYYSKFDLLCIDEFAILDERSFNMDIVQEFFNTVYTARTPLLICTQCIPEKISEMFSIKSIGASIAGRINERAKRLLLQGPDLRSLELR